MKFMDGRIRLMNEILNGIKILKFYAWEKAFLEQVLGHREKELRALKKSQILYSISIASFNSSSFLVRLRKDVRYLNDIMTIKGQTGSKRDQQFASPAFAFPGTEC